ncbi:MAG: hypothetical protein HYZ42_10050, partial [Bacteroidetes bacterium]|nr:hypothetical protein [Bacteroidota bacterium]
MMKIRLAFMRVLFSLIAIMGLSLTLSAQSNDEQLAQQYYNNREFDKAVILYEKLIEKNPGSMYFYENLLTCY